MYYDREPLSEALRTFPANHHYTYTDDTERKLLRILFSSIACNDQYMQYFFPHGCPKASEPWRMAGQNTDPSHPGRPCMHQFQKGEPTYRCKQCGLDDTCVLCWRCYNASDHVGHTVTVAISQKDEGGVCDCGDPEAWLCEMNCRYYKASAAPGDRLPDPLIDAIRQTVAQVLDYVLDVVSCSPQNYQDSRDIRNILYDRDSFTLDPRVYGGDGTDPHDEQFALVLWNDVKHSFHDFETAVSSMTKRHSEYAQFVTTQIYKLGRKIVSTSSNLQHLVGARATFDNIQLACSIRSTRDTFREDMCGTILSWLKDLSASSIVGHNFALRDMICEALCMPWRIGSSATKIRQPLYPAAGQYDDTDDDLNIGPGLITRGEVSPPGDNHSSGSSESAPATGAPAYWTDMEDDASSFDDRAQSYPSNASMALLAPTVDDVDSQPDTGPGFGRVCAYDKPVSTAMSRLDYLMLFDIRLWKVARLNVKSILMSTMISNLDYKMTIGMHFASLYPELIEQYMLADREPELSVILLSTQLFTCPTIATEIVKKYFSLFTSAVYTYITKGRVEPPQSVDLTVGIQPDLRTLKNKRLQRVFSDIEQLVTRNTIKQRISCDQNKIRQIADILLLFEGCAPIIRQVNQHVEYESTDWMVYFYVLTPITRLGGLIARGCYDGAVASSWASIRTIARILTCRALSYLRDRFANNEAVDRPQFNAVSTDNPEVSYSVVHFPVEIYALSIYNPLMAFMTWLIEFGRLESAEQLRSLMSFTTLDPPMAGRAVTYSPEDMLMLILDYPLRTLVVIAQIRSNLWVRNGYTLRTHELHYRDLTMRESGYARDIIGVQTMLVTCDQSRVMKTIITRWSLSTWLRGAVTHAVFDDSQLLYIVEEFLHSLIVLLCERKRLLGMNYDQTNEALIRRELIQALCCEPLPFSDISRKMPEYFSAYEKFESILHDVTTFKAPEGLNDHGSYELKPECYEEVDPYFVHYTATQWDIAETKIKQTIAKTTKKPIETIVIEPRLDRIESGPFARLGWIVGTSDFTLMIYVTLANVVFQRLSPDSSLPDSLLGLTLYLCHVAAIEDAICVQDPERKLPSFSYNACTLNAGRVAVTDGQYLTVLEILYYMKQNSAKFEAHIPLVERVIQLIKENSPDEHASTVAAIEGAEVYMDLDDDKAEELQGPTEPPVERRKRLAKERQAKILADFKKQQQSFADNNRDTFEDEDMMDVDEEEDTESAEGTRKVWSFPREECILCRKPTTEEQMYGTIGLFTESTLFRQTPFGVPEVMKDAFRADETDLDRPSVEEPESTDDTGSDDNTIGKGFPNEWVNETPLVVSCGHIMHLACYESYKALISARRRQYITRNLPEDVTKEEFLCPLCKSLNNGFFPIVFKDLDERLDQSCRTTQPFSEWIVNDVWDTIMQMRTCDDVQTVARKAHCEVVRNNVFRTTESLMTPFYFRKFMSAESMPLVASTEAQAITPEMDMLRRMFIGNSKVLHELSSALGGLVVKATTFNPYHELAAAYAATVSSAEIAVRGADPNTHARNEFGVGASVLDQVSERTMSFLRMLRGNVLAYGAISNAERAGILVDSSAATSYHRNTLQQIGKLFFGQECMYDKNSVTCPDIVPPLLTDDIFSFLAEASVCMVPAMDVEFHHVLLLCYIAQVVKVIYLVNSELQKHSPWLDVESIRKLGDDVGVMGVTPRTLQFMFVLTDFAMDKCGEVGESFNQHYPMTTIVVLVKRLILPFLRKSAILAYVGAPIDYDSEVLLDVQGDETERLLTLLKLPTLEGIYELVGSPHASSPSRANERMQEVISRWFRHFDLARRRPPFGQQYGGAPMTVDFPGVLRLLKLPQRLHGFFQEVGQLKCEQCGTSPEDPGICLFCGKLVCCQNYCCNGKRAMGECNQHMRQCAGYVGIYLLIKKCAILYLRNGYGTFAPAPYLDVHGEIDPNLKRGRPLFLSQKRYNNLVRNLWLQNGVASHIARKIDAAVDNGGWESM
ncbi:uncharacterized protein V1518DRAFT_427403 [Limtongia smithiae]|uniref:uncharacterized protein n=1 Tax=Limtongia smithiae TaxID=1125753 RepID=UPI0034CF1C2B